MVSTKLNKDNEELVREKSEQMEVLRESILSKDLHVERLKKEMEKIGKRLSDVEK